jgi:hypothetical protein
MTTIHVNKLSGGYQLSAVVIDPKDKSNPFYFRFNYMGYSLLYCKRMFRQEIQNQGLIFTKH